MLYLAGIVLAFFLALILGAKKNKSQADYILLVWLIVIGLHLCDFYLVLTRNFSAFPTFIGIGISLPLCHGPFLYLYTCQQSSSEQFKWSRLWHFLPFFVSLLISINYHLMSSTEKVWVFEHKGKGMEWQLLVNVTAIYCSGVVYTLLSILCLLRYRKGLVHRFSNTERINFNWLLYLILWLSVIWGIVLIIHNDEFTYGAVSIFVVWLGYFGIRQGKVFDDHSAALAAPVAIADNTGLQLSIPQLSEEQGMDIDDTTSTAKYQKSSLNDDSVNRIHGELLRLLAGKKPHLNAELTLNELADELQVHPNHLSQVINSRENKNFYELINEMRVREFIDRIAFEDSRQYTLLAIAFDCGFNSKASFNRNFKRYTGLTPSEYVKSRNSVEI